MKPKPAPATTAATPLREANQQRVDAAAQRVRKSLTCILTDHGFRKDVELLIEIALAPVLEIFAAAQPAATPMPVDPSAGDRLSATAAIDLDRLKAAYDDFEDYFVRNYPGPLTIIHKPKWHAPKIFQAVISALKLNDAVAMNSEAPQKLPAAAQPQRESEQPEQALREALKSSMVALDDWLNIHASDHCDEQRVKEARQRVNEHGTIHYIGTVQDRNRAALSPQTDSQEPR